MVIILNDSPISGGIARSLGAYRLASALRENNIEVEVIDFLSHWKMEDLFSYLDSFSKIEWAGISTKFEIDVTSKTIGIISKLSIEDETSLIAYFKSRNIPVAVGGPSADILRPYMVGMADYCVIGYAEIGSVAMHKHITENGPLIYQDYKGIKVINCDLDYKDIDLTNIRTFYHETDFVQAMERLPLEIGRGCMFHCAFCNFAHIGKKPGTYIRDKESLKAEIIDRYTKFKTTHFFFLDDTFNDSVDKMKMIAEIRKETEIPFEFWAYCRLDVLAAQPEMQDLIPEIGWRSLTFGIETFNRDSGKAVGKGADPEKLKNFMVELNRRYPDVEFTINIIAGLPSDTKESLRDTAEWFENNADIASNVHIIPLQVYNGKDSENRKITSKLSLTPEKYGYEVTQFGPVNGAPSILVNWRTKNLTMKSSIDLAKELEPLVNKNRKRKWLSVKKENGLIKRTATDTDPQRYIRKKLNFRNINPKNS